MLGLLARASVVLVAVDVLRCAVLALVDRLLVGTGEFAAVGLPVCANFAVDPLLLVFKMRGFAGSELTTLYALSDAVLLVLAALADFTIAVVSRVCIVLVVIDLV